MTYSMTYPMTEALHTALNSLTASDRRVLRQVVVEMDSSTVLGRILVGVGMELLVLDLAETETLQAMERDRQSDLDRLDVEHPYPPAEGPAIFLDPDAA